MNDHEKRVWHHMYETCETPAEHAERIVRLEELLATALGQVQEMCEANKDRCATCPLHHGHDECLMVAVQNDARDAGVGVITYEGKVERKCSRR